MNATELTEKLTLNTKIRDITRIIMAVSFALLTLLLYFKMYPKIITVMYLICMVATLTQVLFNRKVVAINKKLSELNEDSA